MNAPFTPPLSAMDRALEAIAAIPSPFSPEAFKRRVRKILRSGAKHPFVQTRFERLAETARDRDRDHTLAAARLFIELERNEEIRQRQIAIGNWGSCSRPRITMSLLDEARLVLRWMQRYASADYEGVRDVILYPEFAQAAE